MLIEIRFYRILYCINVVNFLSGSLVVSDKLCQGLIFILKKTYRSGNASAAMGGTTRPDEHKFTSTETSLQILWLIVVKFPPSWLMAWSIFCGYCDMPDKRAFPELYHLGILPCFWLPSGSDGDTLLPYWLCRSVSGSWAYIGNIR